MFVRLMVVGVIALVFTGCTDDSMANKPAPIVDKTVVDCSVPYRVKKGDKLFLLAWQCHMNVDHLATLNGVNVAKPLKVGQVLKLNTLKGSTNKAKSAPVEKKIVTVTESKPKSKSKPTAVITGKWVMPVTAKIAKPFSKKHHGIEFVTQSGQSVRAVADGQVVYSGSKLMSYGKMIIIKHANRYYSAYTKNAQINVNEGDKIRAGMEIGLTGSEPFYFEFRRNVAYIDFTKLIKSNQ